LGQEKAIAPASAFKGQAARFIDAEQYSVALED
jgi:hypothetical protein